jgi:sugar lactone lactonase YvrE
VNELTKIHSGIDFGEGPRWHDGRLWYSDFFRQGVYTLDQDHREELVVAIDDRPSGLGWLPDGTLLIVAMTTRRLLALDPSGTLSEYADLSGVAGGHCNDMVVSDTGHAYVGNFGFDMESGEDFAFTRLAHVTPDRVVHEVPDDLMFPNGSVITPDGRTLIVGETYGSQYTAWDLADDGTPVNKRIWAHFEGTTPDGCCLDAEGAIWMSDFLGSRFLRVHADGTISAEIHPDGHAVACMLGGDDGRTLHCLVSPGSMPDVVAGKGLSSIYTVEVDVPGAGLP